MQIQATCHAVFESCISFHPPVFFMVQSVRPSTCLSACISAPNYSFGKHVFKKCRWYRSASLHVLAVDDEQHTYVWLHIVLIPSSNYPSLIYWDLHKLAILDRQQFKIFLCMKIVVFIIQISLKLVPNRPNANLLTGDRSFPEPTRRYSLMRMMLNQLMEVEWRMYGSVN